MRSILFFFLLFASGLTGNAQEILTGIYGNPVVREKAARLHEGSSANTRDSRADVDVPVNLPFLDDFSGLAVFPSADRWIDHYGYENDDYPVYPVNIGAMTLDAVNDSGNMYPDATPGPATFIADRLTSRYIRLDSLFSPVPKKLTPADSVYFSFYYQPQGRGKAPQANDSLILQFLVRPGYDSLVPGAGVIHIPDKWRRIWYSNGLSLDTFYVRNNKWFAQVMIPVTDTAFFKPTFRFRFFNYVSLASSAEPSWQSNTDQWNIDMVYLNHGRNQYDTVFPELRFINRPTPLLKKYSAMPFPQYCDDPTEELRDSLDVLMSNRDLVPHMSTYGYTITQKGTSYSKSYTGGNYNIQPYQVNPYVTYQKFAHPEMPYLLPVSNADSAQFTVRHIVRDIEPGSTFGDTVDVVQKLYNYYAYDDGTPEASYGLTPAGSKLAYSFRLSASPDTLRAVRIYFNRTLSPADERLFLLCVWNDNAGKPGDTVYSDLVSPRYSDSLNKFVTYHLFPPIAITGTFYVGWIQTTGDNLSVGYDRYNNAQNAIFYNTFGTWTNSAFNGSLMIRPVIGKPIPLSAGDIEASQGTQWSLYPNPCNTGKIYLKRNGYNPAREEGAAFSICDLAGKRLKSGFCLHSIDVSGLPCGFYIVTLRDLSNGRTTSSKLFISR